jgi:hypothetical protein
MKTFLKCLLVLSFMLCEASSFMLPLHKHVAKTPKFKMCSSISIDMNISDDDLPYLEKLEKTNKDKIQKLKSVRDNISKFLKNNETESKSKNITKSTPSSSRSINHPIMYIDFDKLFLNINNIQQIFISNDYDRAVFYMNSGQRFVYFVKMKNDKDLVEKIIKFIKHPVKIIVICDKTLFTDKFKHLYCEY